MNVVASAPKPGRDAVVRLGVVGEALDESAGCRDPHHRGGVELDARAVAGDGDDVFGTQRRRADGDDVGARSMARSVTVVMPRFHTVALARGTGPWHPVSVMPDSPDLPEPGEAPGPRRRSDAAHPGVPRAAARTGRGIHSRLAARHPALERLPPARDARGARVRRPPPRRAALGTRRRRVRAGRRLRAPGAARPARPAARSQSSSTGWARARTSP